MGFMERSSPVFLAISLILDGFLMPPNSLRDPKSKLIFLAEEKVLQLVYREETTEGNRPCLDMLDL